MLNLKLSKYLEKQLLQLTLKFHNLIVVIFVLHLS